MSAPVAAPVSRPARKGEAEPSRLAARVFDFGLLAAFLGLTFLLGVFPLKDTDFWWHLKAGDLIRQSGWVPTADTLTFGAAGHRWVDLHWIFQLLVSFGFEQVGVVGLNVAKCLVTCLAVGLLITSGRRDWPTWATLLAWVPGLLVLSGRMYLRPETLTLLYLATDLAILARWDRRPWLAWGLPVVQLAWVNTQGLFVFGPFLVAVALVDAAIRPGAFAPARRRWWRTSVMAAAATGLACLVNPYGIRGAIYPIELLGTMGNPIFRTIGELKPVPTLFAEVGFDSIPLDLHLFLIIFGGVSFLIPGVWRIATSLQDRRLARLVPAEPASGRKKPPARTARKPRKVSAVMPSDRPLRWFRLVLFGTFSVLGLTATRNSHQFAAVVGTVSAWNFAEWAAAVAARRQKLGTKDQPATARSWPRLVTLGVLVAAIGAVGSGRFYAWSREGRTIGLGEEPLWFAHAAMKFAGGPGMPDRLVGYHNGHPSLFEYYWGPDKKVYTDARLEVMGPELYTEYLDLQGKIGRNEPGWAAELDRLGRPSILVDNLDANNHKLATTLLLARRYRCVWFDPIVSIFVPDSYPVAQEGAVDFLARHYHHEADSATDPATTAAMTKSLRGVGVQVRLAPGGEGAGRALIWLALDHARRLRELDPAGLDGFKQAGILHLFRDPLPGTPAIPRYRLPFDPTIDLPLVAAAAFLERALALDPADGASLYYLSLLDTMRGMDEAALPLLDRYGRQPNLNLEQQREKVRIAEQAAAIRQRLGPEPATQWANLSELEQLVDRLAGAGRVATAADVIEAAHRADARPWAWADRLATMRLHLGQPERARVIWRAATDPPSPALQAARVALTWLVEEDFAAARQGYAEAVALDPKLFEALFGLASVEQAAGQADAAVAAAVRAEATAPSERARAMAHAIVTEATPYRR